MVNLEELSQQGFDPEWFNRNLKINLFLLGGRMGVGKTTIALMSLDKLRKMGYNVEKYALADPIKQIATRLFGWDGKKDARGRRLLQVLGTEAGREYNEGIWVAKTVDRILESRAFPQEIVFIDDWRFPNEYYSLKNSPFFNVYPTIIRASFVMGEDNHSSETSLDNFNLPEIAYMDNIFGLENLEYTVNHFVDRIVEVIK